MNVYDAAHTLASSIKESAELKNFKELQAKMFENELIKTQFDAFQKLQIEIQTAQITGQTADVDKMKEAQSLFEEIQKDPVANQYFLAEMKLNQMMGDVTKIISDAMGIQ